MKKILSLVFLFSILFLHSKPLLSQEWMWGKEAQFYLLKEYDWGEGMAAATDTKGNIYFTGSFGGWIGFGTNILADSVKASAFLVKFNQDEKTLWTEQSISNDTSAYGCWSSSVCADKFGNIYITGSFYNNAAFGNYHLHEPLYSDPQVFLVKYNENGQVIWAKQSYYSYLNAGGTSAGVTVDNFGNIYVTGTPGDTIVFGKDTLENTTVFLVKYDSNGNVKWAKSSDINNIYISTSIATDKTGNIYISGYSGNYQMCLVKYDSSGIIKWIRQTTSPSQWSGGEGYGVTTDKNNNVYVSGQFVDTLYFGTDIIKGRGVFLAKYDSNGNIKWVKPGFDIDTNVWNSRMVSVDTANHICMGMGCAVPQSPTKNRIVFGKDTFEAQSSEFDGPSLIIKMDSSGNVLCGTIINGVYNAAYGNCGASDPSGNEVYLAGTLYSTQIFGSDTLPMEGAYTPFIARWIGCNTDSIKANISAKAPICNGNCSDSLTETPAGGHSPYTYQWSTNPAQITPTATGLCPGNYSVIITDSLGNKIYQNGIIPQIPNHLTITPSKDSICFGSNITLTASGTKTYAWSPSKEGLSCDTCPSSIASPTTTITYTVTGIDTSGCSDTNTSQIKVKPKPNANISGNPSICYGTTATLTASGGNAYRWNTGGANDTINVSPAKDTTYNAIITLNGCSDTMYKRIIVNPLPEITACCDTSIAPGQSAPLNATGIGTFSWLYWTGLSCHDCPNPVATPAVTTTYTVTLTSDSGCSSVQFITIDVSCGNVFIPTAFSPNEAHNNILYVRGDCIATMDFLVFDRWGNKVFESQNLNDGWNGTYNGKPMNMATYVWYLQATLNDGTSVERKGNVTLVR